MKKKTLSANPLTFGDWAVAGICLLLIILCILPMLNMLARSLSSANALVMNEVTLLPVGLNFDAYKTVLNDARYTWSLVYTAMLTVGCTFLSLTMTTMCAYPLIYDQLKGRKILNTIIIITMYFGAGTIPTYLLLRSLKMLDTVWVLIIPNCLSVFNMIIMKSFLLGIPVSLRESAEIDGAGPIKVLMKIYLPLSTPVLATLALFYAVGRWNGFSDALMYVKNRDLYPIQLLLYNILNSTNSMEAAQNEGFSDALMYVKNRDLYPIQLLLYNILNSTNSMEAAQNEGFTTPGLSETLRAATVMFATVPILIVYPWLQKYFITGATLGAVKE